MDKRNFFKTMLIIDEIEFEPSPKCSYRYDYLGLVAEIKNKKENELGLYRQLILKDLFFVIYFVQLKRKELFMEKRRMSVFEADRQNFSNYCFCFFWKKNFWRQNTAKSHPNPRKKKLINRFL